MIEGFGSGKNCCGCGACEQICSHNAITMEYDNEGFLYPSIEDSICVSCGLCEKVCPFQCVEKVKFQQGEVYAAVNKNQEVLMNSSSGGIFTAVATHVLENGGIIYGAAFDETLKLHHIGVETVKGLNELRGSKYLQSDNEDVYTSIKHHLKEDRMVYYVGTGCQVAGLRLFLRKDYSKLITSDLVCHGVPSQKVFNVFVEHLEKKRGIKVIEYSFRDKSIRGWSCRSSSYVFRDIKTNKVCKRHYDTIINSYYNAFMSGSISRESCYICPYASQQRVGDITLADYWGVEKFHSFEEDRRKAVSLIIVNTAKGREVLRGVEDELTLILSKMEWANIVNGNLRKPTSRPDIRDSIYEILERDPDKVIKRFMDKSKNIEYIKFLIRKFLADTPKLKSVCFSIKDLIKR